MKFRSLAILTVIYSVLVLYGSLYPFAGWRVPVGDAAIFFRGGHISLSDAVTNLLAYIPFGFLLARLFAVRGGGFAVTVPATLLGCLLSASVEFMQFFLPSRVSAMSDLVLNAAGTFVGAFICRITVLETAVALRLSMLRRNLFVAGRAADVSIAVLGMWALSQLAPFVPSLDLGNLRHGLKPLWHTIQGLRRFNVPEAAVYAFSLAGLGGIALRAGIDRWRVLVSCMIFFMVVLLLKVPIVGRQLSMEAAAGCTVAVVFLVFMAMLPQRWTTLLAVVSIIAAFLVDELRPVDDPLAAAHPFNWVPFRNQMANLMGIVSVLEGIWPFSALASLMLSTEVKSMSFVTVGGVILVPFVFILEWAQQAIPGRYPDITQVIIALAGWVLPFVYVLSIKDDCAVRRGETVKFSVHSDGRIP